MRARASQRCPCGRWRSPSGAEGAEFGSATRAARVVTGRWWFAFLAVPTGRQRVGRTRARAGGTTEFAAPLTEVLLVTQVRGEAGNGGAQVAPTRRLDETPIDEFLPRLSASVVTPRRSAKSPRATGSSPKPAIATTKRRCSAVALASRL